MSSMLASSCTCAAVWAGSGKRPLCSLSGHETVCPACGYNLPYHATYCDERQISPLELRVEVANMSDSMSNERCADCDGRIGGGKCKISAGQIVHRDAAICASVRQERAYYAREGR
jgi:hypothetical protein